MKLVPVSSDGMNDRAEGVPDASRSAPVFDRVGVAAKRGSHPVTPIGADGDLVFDTHADASELRRHVGSAFWNTFWPDWQ